MVGVDKSVLCLKIKEQGKHQFILEKSEEYKRMCMNC
jgi:hypothetical protein